MNLNNKELVTIIISIIILGLTSAYLESLETIIITLLSFIIIVSTNIIVKKIVANNLEIDIKIKFWEVYRFGFRQDAHFKSPLPMFWIPVFLALLTNAKIWWLAIIEFDTKPKVERVAKRHGRYRFSRVTEWDAGLIAISGVIANIVIAIIALLIPIEIIPLDYFAKLNIFFAAWCLLPISNLDGTKILFASRGIWLILTIVSLVLTLFTFQM